MYIKQYAERGSRSTCLNNPVLNSTLVPSFTELARSSPSKGKTSDRINIDSKIDDKHCRICKIKFESAARFSLDSPWMGCAGKSGKKECKYWVHSVCRFWGCF